MKASWRIVAVFATLPLLMGVAHEHGLAHDEANGDAQDDVFVHIAQVRKATARFHVLDNALGAALRNSSVASASRARARWAFISSAASSSPTR